MNTKRRRVAALLGALTFFLGGCTVNSQACNENLEETTIEIPKENTINEYELLEKLRNSYINFKGKEEYTVLNATYEDICSLYKQAYTLVYNFTQGIPQNNQDQELALKLIDIFNNTDNPILAICNLHNLYVLEFFYVYPTEESYYELFGELAKCCTNEQDVDDVYTEFTNLATLMHLRNCDDKHTDVSLNTDTGYKYMYECENLPYGPRCHYTTRLILK